MIRDLEKKPNLTHPLPSAFQEANISSCCKVYVTFHYRRGKDFSFTLLEDLGGWGKEMEYYIFP